MPTKKTISEDRPVNPVHNMMPMGGGFGKAPTTRDVRAPEIDPETRGIQQIANQFDGVKTTGIFYGFTGNAVTGKRSIELSKAAIPHVAKALAGKYPDYKAVILTQRGKSYFVFANGRPLPEPVEMRARKPEEIAAELANLGKPAQPQGKAAPEGQSFKTFKGFLNVKNGELIYIPTKARFDDILVKRPDFFNVKQGQGAVKTRQAAEQNGWVLCGINADDRDNVVVVISGLTEKHAYAAAKILSTKLSARYWATLHLSGNDVRKTLSGQQIQDYLNSNPFKKQEPQQDNSHYLD